jgi:6-phosphogluconolactonase
MVKHTWLSRRGFVRMLGLAPMGARATWLRAAFAAGPVRFAYIGAMGAAHGVHVFAIDGDTWTLQQVVASESPVSLALHPTGRSLYVLHQVSEHEGLPTGSVEAYRVHARDGSLASLGRRGLSLSATMPRHLAVAPDGSKLAVAVYGGGAYNLLPIGNDGRVGRVCGIVKETGCGPIAEHQETAHPQRVVFDPSGKRVIGADLGSDQLSVLALEDGLSVRGRHALRPGSGPQDLVLHPGGHLLYVGHALDGSISGFGYDVASGTISEPLLRIRGDYADALAIHPAGEYLYGAGGGEVTVWRIEAASGALREVQHRSVAADEVFAMHASPDGRSMVALTSEGIVRMRVEQGSGLLSRAVLVARVPGARSIAIQ